MDGREREPLDGLGQVTLALGDFAGAEHHLYEALYVASTQIIHVTFSILIGMAELLLQTGQPARGVELLALALHHPAGHSEIKARAEAVHNRYEADLPRDVFAAAIERGKTLDLDTVVAQILDEYEDEA